MSTTEELSSQLHEPTVNPRISIVGIGGAGNKLLGGVIGTGGVDADQCVAVNTDRAQLSRSLAQNKILLGEELVAGRGTMGSLSLGRRALQLSAHRVTSFVESSDMTIILVGFGGGTGTAAAPLVAQWARTQVKPVVAIVALPFTHERERRFVAVRGLKKMAEACDCTVVIDNAMSRELGDSSYEGRHADSTAVGTVRSIADALSHLEPTIAKNLMRILMIGPIASACVYELRNEETLSSAVVEALRNPSTNLSMAKAQGAILLHTGPTPLGPSQAAHAYEALTSLAGHRLSFVYGSTVQSSDPSICILLTGYDYSSSIGAFVELLTDLYDVEYGQTPTRLQAPLPLELYQLESS